MTARGPGALGISFWGEDSLPVARSWHTHAICYIVLSSPRLLLKCSWRVPPRTGETCVSQPHGEISLSVFVSQRVFTHISETRQEGPPGGKDLTNMTTLLTVRLVDRQT